MTDDSFGETGSSGNGNLPPVSSNSIGNGSTITPLLSPSRSSRDSSMVAQLSSPSHNNSEVSEVKQDSDNEYYPEVIDIVKNPWIFELPDVLNTTPSRFQNIDLKQELILRHKGALLINRLFHELKLSHRTLYHAWTFFHRFYMRASFKVFGQYETASLALFLACKCTENHRSYKDLIPLVVRDTTKGKIVECKETSKEFWKWRDTIESFECHLIETLCFDLTLDLPYEYTQSLARSETVKMICGEDKRKLDSIMSMVTFFIEDSVMIGSSLCHDVKTLYTTGVIYTSYTLRLPQLLKEVDQGVNIEECHNCLYSFFEILKNFPPEYQKRFERYKFIEKVDFEKFCVKDEK